MTSSIEWRILRWRTRISYSSSPVTTTSRWCLKTANRRSSWLTISRGRVSERVCCRNLEDDASSRALWRRRRGRPKKLRRSIGKGDQTLNQNHYQLQRSASTTEMHPEKTNKTITGNFLLRTLRFHIPTGLRSKPE